MHDKYDKELVSLAYTCSGCNKSAEVMDWSYDLICFGACNSVVLYDPKVGKIISTLVGHKSSVTCVRWLRGSQINLLSGSSDSSVILWTLQKNNNDIVASQIALNGHESSVIAVDGVSDDSFGPVIVSSSSDNTIRTWQRNECGEIACQAVISTGSSFALCVRMFPLPNSTSLLLGFGTDNPELVFHSVNKKSKGTTFLAKCTGHEDWIRSLDFTLLNNNDILVASSSQDMMIRIMRFSTENIDISDGYFQIKKQEISIENLHYYLSLESVLYGHEGWVYSVNWSPYEENGSPHLLSASFDRTILIWKPCPDTGVWLEDSRMGELGGDNTLGYYGAKFSPDGSCILAYSYQGSFHLWKKMDTKWVAEFMIGGHSDSVTDISWERKGRYLISVSYDKTTRLHAPCIKGTYFDKGPWCELSRPQIHGHALHSLVTLENLGFASCSEEKVVRIFLPSLSVLKFLNYFSDSLFDEEIKSCGSKLPSSASITALGLSNKASFDGADKNESTAGLSVESDISHVSPIEDFLVQNTLWPEVMKLYGHGNDVFAVAASKNGSILATACKATSAAQAQIILWDTQSWNIITKLDGHQLTVTQMEFSPDDEYLLSVSRDRKWCLFKKTENRSYAFLSSSPKGKSSHSRIIWCCSWTHDGLFFATGSRDSKLIVWDKESPASTLESDHGSVTALDFGPIPIGNEYILAVGHESGKICIYSWLKDWSLLYSLPTNIGHHLTVQRLRFRPIHGMNGDILQLASCSEDHSVRVYDINLRTIQANLT